MERKKVAAVTGATGAIGSAIAEMIAEMPEFEVVLLVRNETKGQRLTDQLRAARSKYSHEEPETVRMEIVDVSSSLSIRQLADRWKGPLDVLVNNAAVTPRKREENLEGIELQWATNVLGYVRMMRVFAPVLSRSPEPRIVNVASYWAGGLDIEDVEFKHRTYDNDTAYRQSKQADRMLTKSWSEKIAHLNITVNSCHPGDVNSILSNNLGFGGNTPPRGGAATPVWLATASEVKGQTGCYFASKSEQPCSFSSNSTAVKQLHDLVENYQ